MFFERRINGLGETGFLKPDDLRSFQAKESFEFTGVVMLHNGIMFELRENLLPTVFGKVVRDENEMELAFAAAESVAADEQNAGTEYEWK